MIACLAVLALALMLTACGADSVAEPVPADQETATAAQAETAAADGFTTDASLSGGGDNADASIANIRFGQHDGFERLVIDFATAQTSASAVPRWRMEKAAGVLRIHLPNVTATAFTDGELAGAFLRRVYVVRGLGQSLFVDVFVPASYKYRVAELGEPVRLVIDVAADGTDSFALPAAGELTVLTSPLAGATIQGHVTVSGYSRNFEANNVIILQDSEGNELARAIATSSDYIETWGYFSTALTVPQRTGAGSLLVGDFDARDGSFQGVTIPVRFGGS